MELGRRVDLLIRLIQNEAKEPGPKRGSKKEAADRPPSAQGGAAPMEED